MAITITQFNLSSFDLTDLDESTKHRLENLECPRHSCGLSDTEESECSYENISTDEGLYSVLKVLDQDRHYQTVAELKKDIFDTVFDGSVNFTTPEDTTILHPPAPYMPERSIHTLDTEEQTIYEWSVGIQNGAATMVDNYLITKKDLKTGDSHTYTWNRDSYAQAIKLGSDGQNIFALMDAAHDDRGTRVAKVVINDDTAQLQPIDLWASGISYACAAGVVECFWSPDDFEARTSGITGAVCSQYGWITGNYYSDSGTLDLAEQSYLEDGYPLQDITDVQNQLQNMSYDSLKDFMLTCLVYYNKGYKPTGKESEQNLYEKFQGKLSQPVISFLARYISLYMSADDFDLETINDAELQNHFDCVINQSITQLNLDSLRKFKDWVDSLPIE